MEKRDVLTLGSLFDGSGGFPLGGLLSGILPVWASEIEPFPIRVTTKRLPFMKHYGDIATIDGGEVEPVDIITFGSPCTDMSVAGRRAGLDGQQSCLFYQAIRIIKEMRCATNGKYPRWICWENVPGAFSSNNGADFKAVLDAVIGIVEQDASVPMPEKNKWPHADCYMGDGWSVAYRTIDAKYWGVPQRRKRIYLVGDLNGQCAGKVLFESEGLSGYSAAGFRSWQRAAGNPSGGAGASGIGLDGYNGSVSQTASTLGVNCGMSTGRNGVVLNDQGGQRMNVSTQETGTLRAEARHPPCVLDDAPSVFENHSQDTRYVGPIETAPTVSATYGTGGNNQPFVVGSTDIPFCKGTRPHSAQEGQTWKEANIANTLNLFDQGETRCNELVVRAFGIGSDKSRGMLSDNPHAGFYEADSSRTLDSSGGNPSCHQGGIAIVGYPAYTITPTKYTQVLEEESPTLMGRDFKDATCVTAPCYALDYAAYNQGRNAQYTPCVDEEVAPTQVAKGPGAVFSDFSVRRLTPTECARLQGFPDWWCASLETPSPSEAEIAFWRDVWETRRRIVSKAAKPKTDKQIVKWLMNPHSDAAEYKMWGNGVALPCVFFVLSGIVFYTQMAGQ